MIYLDHHATTPLSAAARSAMEAALEDGWANASSQHAAGRAARSHVERARRSVAEAIGGAPADVVLTSGGTEACDLMVRGVPRPARIVTTTLEHPAILEACLAWEEEGVELVRLQPREGLPPSVDALGEALVPGALVAAQWANHETGAILPVADYALACRRANATFVVDAIQAFGRLPIDVSSLGVHALGVASHKVGGPCAGAVWVDRALPLRPRLRGGAQERGRRAGSQDAVSAAGFAAAAEGIGARLGAMAEVAAWRDQLETTLRELGAVVNGDEGPRIASVVNASLAAWRSDVLVAALDVEGLCVSAGAACSSGVGEPSPALRALYPDAPWRAESALRLSLGPEGLDAAAIDDACAVLRVVVARRR